MAKRILFVEDERWCVDDYFLPLEERGIEVELAGSGDEAVQKLRETAFDVIVLDIMFPPGEALGESVVPRTAGLDLLRMIRKGKIKGSKVKSTVRVIVLTAILDMDVAGECRKLGVDGYVTKPVSFEQVIKTLAEK